MDTPENVRVLYFAWLRERVGAGEEFVELAPGVDTVGALITWLRARSPGHDAAFAAMRTVRCAVNQDFAGPEAAVRGGDEVAFFPPVTGG
jgi:molybdopterin synthase sulfur carrier subunit